MRKNFRKKIDFLLSIVIIAILLPLFITIICQRMQLEEVIYGEMQASAGAVEDGTEPEEEMASAEEEAADDASTEEEDIGGVTEEEGDTGTLPTEVADTEAIEAQVVGIVAKEISANADRQAILAQCVIARTNLYDAREKNTAEPEALDIEEMQELWGGDFEELYQEMQECVALTQNQVLVWNGDYIFAAYHALSAGRTRNITEIYEDADMPYLTEKLCREDATAEGYLAVNYWPEADFLEECRSLFPETSLEAFSDIEILSRDETGYVEEIKVGSETYQGEEFRSRWGLNSACFTVTETDGQVRIVTKGLGHGFGLSQNMAGCMAREGSTYEEILAYFYPGTEIKEASELN